jgi:hypothetical protein
MFDGTQRQAIRRAAGAFKPGKDVGQVEPDRPHISIPPNRRRLAQCRKVPTGNTSWGAVRVTTR